MTHEDAIRLHPRERIRRRDCQRGASLRISRRTRTSPSNRTKKSSTMVELPGSARLTRTMSRLVVSVGPQNVISVTTDREVGQHEGAREASPRIGEGRTYEAIIDRERDRIAVAALAVRRGVTSGRRCIAIEANALPAGDRRGRCGVPVLVGRRRRVRGVRGRGGVAGTSRRRDPGLRRRDPGLRRRWSCRGRRRCGRRRCRLRRALTHAVRYAELRLAAVVIRRATGCLLVSAQSPVTV